ncbi:RNA 2',3'-cyclic phosphodiesterase [Candidatus Woesearchaeota archaeon]|nr:RNA 2',3'-cyclic phosphodiesterase [Candidatus Woesearchaeota archaeon]
MKRLFVGIPLPEEVKAKLKPALNALTETGVKAVPADNLHLTIKFLGDVEENKIQEICSKLEILAKYKPFLIKLKKINTFGEKQIRVIWVGLESNEMVLLMKRANESLNYIRMDGHQEEIPHLTLARVNKVKDNEELLNILKKYEKVELGEVLVDKFYLYESELTPEGPVYGIVKEFGLNTG